MIQFSFFFLFHLGQKCLKSDAVLSSLKPIKRYKRSICPILGDVHLVSPLYIYSVNGEEISRLCKCPVFIKLTRTHFNIHWWFLPESIITVTVATWWFFFAVLALHCTWAALLVVSVLSDPADVGSYPQPGTKPASLTLEGRLNHWTTREVLKWWFF